MSSKTQPRLLATSDDEDRGLDPLEALLRSADLPVAEVERCQGVLDADSLVRGIVARDPGDDP